jgi:fumarate reductase subunit C
MPSPTYTPYHPRWLRQRVSTYWWLQKRSYLLFTLREMTCMFVGWFVVYLLMLVDALGRGADAYLEFLAWSARGSILTLNIVSLGFILYHAITFFQAAPQALVVHLGKRRVPSRFIAVGHYGALIAASAIVWWLVGA